MMAQAQALVSMMTQGGAAGASIQQMMSMAGAAGGPKGGSNASMMEGDWICDSCGDHQFARNVACRKCGAPKSGGSTEAAPFSGRMNKANQIPGAFGMGSNASFGDFGGGGGSAQPTIPGDWNCPACGDHQFARNQACRKCGAPKSGAGAGAAVGGGKGGKGGKGGAAAALAAMLEVFSGGGGSFGGYGPAAKGQMVEGDWLCPACGDHQFARNMACRKCGAEKDTGAVLQQATTARIKPGDWICPGCGDHQFMRNMECRKCGTPKPESAVERSGPYMK